MRRQHGAGTSALMMSWVKLVTPIYSTSLLAVCDSWSISRSCFLASLGAPALVASVQSKSMAPDGELPMVLRDFTKIVPLVQKETGLPKQTGLSLSELAQRLEHDLILGRSGAGGYIISGDLDPTIFRDDCVFVDPNNRVASLSQYQKALTLLFDTDTSSIELVQPLTVNEDDRTISGVYRSYGFLRLPWKPYVTAYESTIICTIDDDGLVSEQRQVWSKSSLKALQETFTPTIFTPPPISMLPKPDNEPPMVTRLFERVNGRRPYEYSALEREEISHVVDSIADRHEPWRGELLPGKWKLVYLEEGPQGTGVDRRIPFPEFGFNDSYQSFTKDSVTNLGEVLGPLLSVSVAGGLREELPADVKTPKRFIANIVGGDLCTKDRGLCANLSFIKGEGIFDILYINERLRILRNINGGGARGVQIKMAY